MQISTRQQIAAGALALLAWGVAVVSLAPEGASVGSRADVRVVQPTVGAVVEVGQGEHVVLAVAQASDRSAAELVGADEIECRRQEEAADRGANQVRAIPGERVCWPAPERAGHHLLGADVVVDGRIVGRRGRLVRVIEPLEPEQMASGRVQVAAAHVAAGELEEQLNSELPALLNPVLASLLPTLSSQIEARSREWRVPGWLVDGVRLGEQSSVVVSGARVEMHPSGLSVAMNIHVDLRVEVLNRPVIAPRRRGTRVIDFRIRDNFTPARFNLGMAEWPQVRVHEAQLRGDYCRRVERDPFQSVCERVTRAVYDRLEREIEERVGEYATGALASLELDSLITETIIQWASDIELGDRVRTLLDGAELGVSAIRQDEAGAHFAVEVRRDWLRAHFGPDELALADDPERPIDLAISVALVDRVLQELFARPLVDVVAMFETAAGDAQEPTPSQSLRAWLNPEDASRGGELTQFLRLVGLELRPDAVVSPWLDVNEHGALVFTVYDAQMFRAAGQGGPERSLSTSAEAHAVISRGEEGWRFEVDPREAVRSLAVEAVVAGDSTEARRYRRQLEAAVRQLYLRLGNQSDPAPGDGGGEELAALLQGVLDDLPAMPSVVETAGLRVGIDRLNLNGDDRTVEVRANFELR